MDKLKIFCKNSEDAKNKLNILEQYGIEKGGYSGDISSSAYYVLKEEDKKIEECWPASTDGIKDIPEVYYDFFNISDEARAKAYSNCSKYASNPIIRLLSGGINYWFVWEDTPEGRDYWSELLITLRGTDTSKTLTFKEGDKVIIHIEESKRYAFGTTEEMFNYNNKEATIVKKYSAKLYPGEKDLRYEYDGYCYTLDIDNGHWSWSSHMLIPCNNVRNADKFHKKEITNNNLIFTDYENQLQRKEVNLSGRDGAEPVRVCNRRNKARIASKHPSYQKAIGRG